MSVLWIIVYALGALYALWVAYLAVMALKRARALGTLSTPARVLGTPLLWAGIMLNWAINMTLASVVFLEPPSSPRELVTGRLARHYTERTWRGALARWVCHHLLDAFDPSGPHCE